MKKIASISLIALLTACSARNSPDLPDLNRKSFSEEEILQKQKELTKKIKGIRTAPTDGALNSENI
ncbi:MAG: hypothetical protein LBO73_02915 [Holosporaceae bacterium]|jgi:hypothetical protein|nr:hypothetical protein [Holosporaceae bacterium]